MLKTRLCAAGIGLLAATTFALAGCNSAPAGEGTDTPATTSAAQGDAKDAFVSAVKKLNEQTAKVETKMDGLASLSGSGLTDPVAKKASFDMDMSIAGTSMKISVIAVDREIWMKITGTPGMPDKWMHVAADKIKPGSNLDLMKDGDPAGTERLVDGLVEVEWDGTGAVKGTVDVTKAGTVDEDTVKQLGDKAKAVPFTATIDGEGRVSSMTVDMNAVMPGTGKLVTTYSAFGEPVDITKPADGDVIEMPAEILAAMNA